jgi:hypothetical protein
MIVLREPIRVALCLRFAIWLNVCDGRRRWLLGFDRSAIRGCVEANAVKTASHTVEINIHSIHCYHSATRILPHPYGDAEALRTVIAFAHEARQSSEICQLP